MDFDLFVKYLSEELNTYFGFSQIPLSGCHWEERIYKALKRCGCENLHWNYKSQKPGCDIGLNAGEYKFSAKSSLFKNGYLKISSFRTTKYKLLSDKLNFFDNVGKTFTHYLVISRIENNNDGSITYKVFLIDSNLIVASNFIWKEIIGNKNNITGWNTEFINGVQMKIERAMSDQFWFYIDENILTNNDKIKLLIELVVNNLNERQLNLF